MHHTRTDVISKIKMHLFKQWKLFFTGLIIFWLFIMVTFSVGLISRNGNLGIYLNHRKLHKGRINYYIHGSFFTKKIYHPESVDSDQSKKSPFTNNDKNDRNNFEINNNDTMTLVEQQATNLTINGSESNQNKSGMLNKLGNKESIGSDLLQGVTSKGNRNDGSLWFPSRHRNPVIATLPRDKISETQINGTKNKLLPKSLPEVFLQSKNVSDQNVKLGNSVRAPKDHLLPNNTLLPKTLSSTSSPYIKANQINQPLLAAESRFTNPENRRAVISSHTTQVYRPGDNLSTKLPLQQLTESQELQNQKENIHNKVNPIIDSANQNILNKDSSINANYQKNQILHRQNGSPGRGMLGPQSANINALKKDILKDLLAELLKYKRNQLQKNVQYNSQKGALPLQNNPSSRQQPVKVPFFKSRLLPKLNGYVPNKLSGAKDRIVGKTIPKYGASKNQERIFVDKLAPQAVPNNRVKLEQQRNPLQKQSNLLGSRKGSNVLPQDKLELQKQTGGNSLNGRLAQPETADLNAKRKVNVEQVLEDNVNHQPAAQVGTEKKGIESDNKEPFGQNIQNIDRLVDQRRRSLISSEEEN